MDSDSPATLITGANRGLGLALTQACLASGHRVFAAARHADQASELRKLAAAASSMQVLNLDVTQPEEVAQAARTVASESGQLDLLINNAGVHPEQGNETLEQLDLQHFRSAFEVNLIGVARVCQAFLPLLRKSPRPRIVNISSGAASISTKRDHSRYCYSASKAALNMLTRSLASELKPQQVAVVALSPGWVRTDMGGSHAPLAPEDSAQAMVQTMESLTLEQTGLFLDRCGETGTYAW